MARLPFLAFSAVAFATACGAGGDSWGVAPDGTVWTTHSRRFLYAPTLEFGEVSGARRYVSEVIDDIHGFSAVTTSTARVNLAPGARAERCACLTPDLNRTMCARSCRRSN